VARLEVAAHPLGPHDEALDEPGEAVEHVVEREERVGDDDALGDEWEMSRSCQSATFSSRRARARGRRARARRSARRRRDSLVRHRRRALLAAAERLLHLADLGAREVPDLEGEGVERGGDDRERGSSSAWRSRWRIWVDVGAGSRPSRSHASRSSSGSVAA
jgi:hypothetical protein